MLVSSISTNHNQLRSNSIQKQNSESNNPSFGSSWWPHIPDSQFDQVIHSKDPKWLFIALALLIGAPIASGAINVVSNAIKKLIKKK